MGARSWSARRNTDYYSQSSCLLTSQRPYLFLPKVSVCNSALHRIGQTHYTLREFKKSREFFLESLKVRKTLNSNTKLILTYIGLLNSEIHLGNFEEARTCFDSLLVCNKENIGEGNLEALKNSFKNFQNFVSNYQSFARITLPNVKKQSGYQQIIIDERYSKIQTSAKK